MYSFFVKLLTATFCIILEKSFLISKTYFTNQVWNVWFSKNTHLQKSHICEFDSLRPSPSCETQVTHTHTHTHMHACTHACTHREKGDITKVGSNFPTKTLFKLLEKHWIRSRWYMEMFAEDALAFAKAGLKFLSYVVLKWTIRCN